MISIQEFPAYWELRTVLARAYANPQKARIVFERARAGDPGDVVFEGAGANQVWDGILRTAWAAGRLGALLRVVLEDRSVAGFHGSIRKQRASLPVDLSTAELEDDGAQRLEAFVGPNRLFLDVATWRQELATRERQVCHIRAGDMQGTGFLVGPDAVLTCYHVLGPALEPGGAADVTFTFDYQRVGAGGGAEGITASLASSDAVVDKSPVAELDFMVVRLDKTLGSLPLEEAVKGAPARGSWALPKGPRELRAGLACLQHPRGQPLKLAIDPAGVPSAPEGGKYLRYDLPTQPGSSGAPVFDNEYRLIALHRFGVEGAFNAGVAIEAIASRPALAAYVR
jgi:hypothetical protein